MKGREGKRDDLSTKGTKGHEENIFFSLFSFDRIHGIYRILKPKKRSFDFNLYPVNPVNPV